MQQATATSAILTAAELGGAGRPDPNLCATTALRLLTEAAGQGYVLSSFSFDIAPTAIAADAKFEASISIDKRTRSIAFLSLKALAGPALVFSARAVFSASR
jgi:hypothetical protein